MSKIENDFHGLLLEKFQEAKDAGATGEFDIRITCHGYLNSKQAKIETKVSIGRWETQGVMTARTVALAFPIAIERAGVNTRHEVKLLDCG